MTSGLNDAARKFIAKHARVDFEASTALAPIEHTFSHFRLRISPLLWTHATPLVRIGDNDDIRWQSLAALDTVGLPAPVRKLLESLR